MSNWRKKAAEVKAAGVAERGNFTPTGTPLRMYNYWLSESGSATAIRIRGGLRKENFCHFWRVVAIWAPLLFLFVKAQKFFTSKFGLATVATGVLAAVVLLINSTIGWMDFLISIGVIAAASAALFGVIVLVIWLKENHLKALERICIGGIVMAILAFLTASVIDFGFIALAWVAGTIGAVLLAIFLLVSVGEWISGLRKVAREKTRVANELAWEKFFAGEGPDPSNYPEPKPAPAWAVAIGNFLRSIGDFLILLGQVVRVKKWKICPMVEIKQDKIDYDSGWETA